MEHIEEAGIHSGDSSCVVPPASVSEKHLATIRDYTRRIAAALKVVGLMNVQYAIKDDTVYVLEVNPRASRTVPYLSKATGVPLAQVAARVMAGKTLAELNLVDDLESAGVFVKSPVFPFVRFPGVDTILGPEMKSTGEVMGGASSFGLAFMKAMLGIGAGAAQDAARSVSASTTRTSRTCCRLRAGSSSWASTWWRRAARPPISAPTASSAMSSTRSTRVVPAWPTRSSIAASRWWSTHRSDASRSSTTRPFAVPR